MTVMIAPRIYAAMEFALTLRCFATTMMAAQLTHV